MALSPVPITQTAGFHFNCAAEEAARRDLPPGFLEFLLPLHRRFTPRQQELIEKRYQVLAESHAGRRPRHLPPSPATEGSWRIELPEWCADQRNQMTGPADDAELVVKMLNSGAPGVMLDLEDSTVNQWDHQRLGAENIIQALHGKLAYFDKKRGHLAGIRPSKTVIWVRPRGLHISQRGLFGEEPVSASLFDVGRVFYCINPAQLRHPLCIYIPKSESAEEALWWRDLFQALAELRGLPRDYIKCMALIESHPLAYQMEEFLFNLREHIVGLNLGRWDYMASLIHFNLCDPEWVLPDRNTIPHDVPFFQRVRELMPEICHRRGVLAIGGMTALYPSREDAELNARALAALEKDKKNEAGCLMDGAWTGHPDQNQIAVDQFPAPNQIGKLPSRDLRREELESAGLLRNGQFNRYADLRAVPRGVGCRTLAGTRAAIRTVIRYRNGVLNGKGASLLDGYMEDLATDRIYRLMIAQRMRHSEAMDILDEGGNPVVHTPELITRLFDEELEKIVANPARADIGSTETFREARRIAEAMILNNEFNPV
jgi:malate synthase